MEFLHVFPDLRDLSECSEMCTQVYFRAIQLNNNACVEVIIKVQLEAMIFCNFMLTVS